MLLGGQRTAQEPCGLCSGLRRPAKIQLGTCYVYSSRYSRLCLLDLQSILNSITLCKLIDFTAIRIFCFQSGGAIQAPQQKTCCSLHARLFQKFTHAQAEAVPWTVLPPFVQEEDAPFLLILIENSKKVELTCWSRKRISLFLLPFSLQLLQPS